MDNYHTEQGVLEIYAAREAGKAPAEKLSSEHDAVLEIVRR